MKKIKITMIAIAVAIASVLTGEQTANAQLKTEMTECISLTKNLSFGMRDGGVTPDVAILQSYLINHKYLASGNITGYFGPLTLGAAKSFQADNSIITTGFVGPLTRARLTLLTCELVNPVVPPVSAAPVITSMSPSVGPFGTVVTIYGRGFSRYDNSINFANVSRIAFNVQSVDGVSLQYTIPSSPCVQGSQVCPAIAFVPGTFLISVSNAAGTSNSVTFTATNSANQGTNPPTISGVSGPSNLTTGQTGTWNIQASDPTGQGLSYQAVWGDEVQMASASASSNGYVQSATFTHVYSQAGTYAPRFTVRAGNGSTAQTSITTVVSGQATNGAPVINSLSPNSGPYGTTVTVFGNNFTSSGNSINFGGASNAITGLTSNDNHTIQFTVPATPCSQGSYCSQSVIEPGTYPVSVTNQNGTSAAWNFTVTSGSSGTVNQSVALNLSQTGYVNDLQITPTSIVEDSRCPIGVQCVQAGRVVVQTILNSNAGQTTVNMAVGEQFIINGYTVRLISVTPDRYYNQTISNNQYRMTYQIIK